MIRILPAYLVINKEQFVINVEQNFIWKIIPTVFLILWDLIAIVLLIAHYVDHLMNVKLVKLDII